MANASLPGRIGILDFTRSGQSVAHFSLHTPHEISFGSRDGPYPPEATFPISAGEWHKLEVTMTGSTLAVRVDDGAPRSFAALLPLLPDVVQISAMAHQGEPPPEIKFDRIEIVPIARRAHDAFDAAWLTRETGVWNRMIGPNLTLEIAEGEHTLEVYALAHSGRTSAFFTRSYHADGTAPTLVTPEPTLVLPLLNVLAVPDGRVSLAGTASDAKSGMDRVEVWLDGVAGVRT